MNETVLTKSIYLKAEPAKVWAYLTDPEKLAKWFHKPTSPLLEGEYEVLKADGSKLMWGTVLLAEPYQRLEYTFAIPPLGDHVTTVKWLIEEVPAGSKLSLIHEGLPPGAEAFDLTLALDKGWDEHLGQMRSDIVG